MFLAVAIENTADRNLRFLYENPMLKDVMEWLYENIVDDKKYEKVAVFHTSRDGDYIFDEVFELE